MHVCTVYVPVYVLMCVHAYVCLQMCVYVYVFYYIGLLQIHY